MSERSNRAAHSATLFESITEQTTITERQRFDVSVRLNENGVERNVAGYIDTAATADGLEDVIEDPETR